MSFNATHPQDLTLLPPKVKITTEIQEWLLKARIELAELKGYSFSLTNPFLLLSPAVIKEAVASSEIENIHTTVINVLENQLFPEEEQSKPDKEVLRYREALLWGYKQREKTALTTRLITGIHQKLMPELNGQYRTIQNAITEGGKVIRYTPPLQKDIPRLMSNLEIFLNENKSIDPLIKAIIGHYQFEAIHPFNDGNGRTGRILMLLGLVQDDVLNPPVLFISGYINKFKSDYYQKLLDVTVKEDWQSYILFMLQGFFEQAKETKELALSVQSSFFQLKKLIKKSHQSIYSADLLEVLFSYPIINPLRLAQELDIHRTTATRYLQELERGKILQSKVVGTYHLYANVPLLNALHKQ